MPLTNRVLIKSCMEKIQRMLDDEVEAWKEVTVDECMAITGLLQTVMQNQVIAELAKELGL